MGGGGQVGRLASVVLLIALLAPSAAIARPQGNSECRYLTSQINFFDTRIERAKQLRNDLWEARLTQHRQDLIDRRKERCPGHGNSQAAFEAFRELMSLAAQGALSFFTLGAM
jgi:hypothetical protein